MKLWILSDIHTDRGIEDIAVCAPPFDVFVCAGDVVTGDISLSIEMVAAIARGKPAIFVAGNHEWMTAVTIEETLELGHAAAARHGVNFLECDSVEIGGVRFAGATLWTPDDVRYTPSSAALAVAGADIVVTHFEPSPGIILPTLTAGGVWIYGHHHGHSNRLVAGRRLIRNAYGYLLEQVDDAAARPDYVVEV